MPAAESLLSDGAEDARFLTSVTLENFRSFESVSFRFANRLTVVFGKNGAGKSSVIDALALRFHGELSDAGVEGTAGVWLTKEDWRRVAKSFGDRLVYEPSFPPAVGLRGFFGKETESTLEDLYGPGDGCSILSNDISDTLQSSVAANLPVFAVFLAARRYDAQRLDLSNDPITRTDGYRNCLDVARGSEVLISWFKRQLLKRGRAGVDSSEAEAVLSVLISAVPGLVSVEYDADLADLVVNFGSGEVPFGSLSDGQRGFFGMIAEIAIRCTQLNPHLNGEALRLTEGLVLVDEIDLHLHPEWQRQIVRSLVETFTNLQFVITTHSPIVLSEVQGSSIIDLDRPEAGFTPALSAFGMDSAWVTRHVMHAATRPQWAQKRLEEVEQAIDDGRNSDALGLIRSLREDLGEPLDPELIRWEAFVGEAGE
jgi:predicted ATP-binding protein involved in virulence